MLGPSAGASADAAGVRRQRRRRHAARHGARLGRRSRQRRAPRWWGRVTALLWALRGDRPGAADRARWPTGGRLARTRESYLGAVGVGRRRRRGGGVVARAIGRSPRRAGDAAVAIALRCITGAGRLALGLAGCDVDAGRWRVAARRRRRRGLRAIAVGLSSLMPASAPRSASRVAHYDALVRGSLPAAASEAVRFALDAVDSRRLAAAAGAAAAARRGRWRGGRGLAAAPCSSAPAPARRPPAARRACWSRPRPSASPWLASVAGRAMWPAAAAAGGACWAMARRRATGRAASCGTARSRRGCWCCSRRCCVPSLALYPSLAALAARGRASGDRGRPRAARSPPAARPAARSCAQALDRDRSHAGHRRPGRRVARRRRAGRCRPTPRSTSGRRPRCRHGAV